MSLLYYTMTVHLRASLSLYGDIQIGKIRWRLRQTNLNNDATGDSPLNLFPVSTSNELEIEVA